MSKRLSTPTSRLVCSGSARALTNSDGQSGVAELIFPLEYE